MKNIGIISVARSDFGIYLPILRELEKSSTLNFKLLVTGMHFSEKFGKSSDFILKEGFTIHESIIVSGSIGEPEHIVETMANITKGFSEVLKRNQFDAIMVLGDRYEMFAAAISTIPFNIPLIHIHGGEVTKGAIDEVFRHSLTKISHIHFVSHTTYRERVIQMGENPDNVYVTGAPGLDNIKTNKTWRRQEIDKFFNINEKSDFLLITFHPVTTEFKDTYNQINALIESLESVQNLDFVITYPNADTRGTIIIEQIEKFAKINERVKIIKNAGQVGYLSLMLHCRALVGNSSSGILEAASFQKPVVNIGSRQEGRIKTYNVIDVETTKTSILKGIQQAIDPNFINKLKDLKNPYGDGTAAKKICELLEQISFTNLIPKKFYDLKK